ncbi:MAG TPA: type II CAAX endopeptidase family protein [Steroidobacteraceae bacterium]|nr:type II CAAX endopeptidase family protein [Steroidobacteraceae bacterium]
MRAFSWIIIVTVLTLLMTASVAYPGYLLAHSIDDAWKFHRIASRIAMLIALSGVIWVVRRYRLGNRRDLGFAPPTREYLAIASRYFLAGVAMMLPMLALMFAADLRLPQPDVTYDAAFVVQLVISSIVSGIIVALIEETLFRGVLHAAIERDRGAVTAVIATSLLFAVLHFVGKARVPDVDLHWASGWQWLALTLRLFTRPGDIVDAFLVYLGIAVLLGAVRSWMGHTAGCVGLHAGWVAAMLVVLKSTDANLAAPLAFLQGRFDHFVGWLVFGWTLVMGAAFVIVKRRGLAFARSAPP